MTTLPFVVDEFLETKAKPNTRATYRDLLYRWIDIVNGRLMDIKDVTEDLISPVFTWMQRKTKEKPHGHSASYESTMVNAVSSFFNYLGAESKYYGVTVNLARLKFLKRQRQRKIGFRYPVSSQEVEDVAKIINFIVKAEYTPLDINHTDLRHNTHELMWYRDRSMLITMADTGLRNFELRELQIKDIHYYTTKDDNKQYTLRVVGKGDKEAIVRISTRTVQVLKEYIEHPLRPIERRKRTDYIFESYSQSHGGEKKPFTNNPLARNESTQKIVKKWMKSTNVEGDISPHTFRHFFGTIVWREKHNAKLLQELMRHTNINTSMRYTHMDNTELDAGYDAIFNKR